MNRKPSLPLVLVPLLVAAGCGTAEDIPPQPEAPDDTISLPDAHLTSLGDSYASMGGRDSPRSGPDYCYRTIDNYPALVGERAAVFEDVSCQGAVTDDLLQPRSTPDGELPSQLEALTPEVDIVTLTIGGNDIGFGRLADCVLLSTGSEGQSDCRGLLESEVAQEMDALPAQLDEIYEQIGQRTDGAEVFATGYMPLVASVPESDEVCVGMEVISDADQEWTVGLIAELNHVVEAAAERNGAEFVMPEGADNHTSCAEPEQRWVDLLGVQTDAYPLHPTSLGQQAMADALTSSMEE
ncbi:SGNH/GDSL hydrolase family protein [Corynebacterium sputi]|uniref:SGNH/GDSL hydrolase family protein n=1 Tax=Corynebacterium sputi TaxID=489915 RepID=UPI0004050FB6|nr:SGNH/GDSL hydrolase family protein [Corynebacterium sputi]